MSINRHRLHCSFVSTPIIHYSRSAFFDLLNLLPLDIQLSIDDKFYLYLLTSVAHTTVNCKNNTICPSMRIRKKNPNNLLVLEGGFVEILVI
ncbi:unnamed protein product, partial [Schistosoma curassoni]